MYTNRREFLHDVAAGSALMTLGAMSLAELRAAEAPSQKITVGIMGTNGRGIELAKRYVTMPGVNLAYLCDVDQRNVQNAASEVNKVAGISPVTVGDFRKILDDKSVDALVIAAPDHWHAPATIMACAAGKHVYCEKPCSHNAQEGEWMVAAARKHKRVVQLGTQRRSMSALREGIERLQAGEIGRVFMARCWYNNPRPPLAPGKAVAVPKELDYALWQGPAPEREYRERADLSEHPEKNNYHNFHYHWHWFWNWGTGELGNNGIHTIDVCRWGLGVDYPTKVTSGGGRYCFEDDGETPDTNLVTFDFGDKSIIWEGRSWYRKRSDDPGYDIAFYGSKGMLAISGGNYRIFDPAGKELANVKGEYSDERHVQNFLDGIRNGTKLNAEIEEGHKSTLLCHLGNIAYRTGHTVTLDPKTHKIAGDPQATALWGREYRPGWEPKV